MFTVTTGILQYGTKRKLQPLVTSQMKLLMGQYMGLVWNVGETLCAKILTCPDKGWPQIIHRDNYFAQTPDKTALSHLPEYPKDKLWPKIELNPKAPRAPDLGTAPNNSQGAKIAHPENMGHNNPPKAKRLKLTVDGAKPMTHMQ